MPNEFTTKPELAEHFPPVRAVWQCPITGLWIPKDPAANLRWRAKLLGAAEEDRAFQTDLYTACAQSALFFINFACFTLRIFESKEDGGIQQAGNTHVPFVTWEIQDRHIKRIEECIDRGQDLLSDKSRDMGATWSHIVVYVHRFLFRDSESHLLLSRKEDAVDVLDGLPKNYPHGQLADPGTLFGKIDYVLSRLPEWMVPRCSRKKMHLVNLDTKTRIDGESANATAGSSDRRTSIFMDEMAKMKEGKSIKRSTRDVTACRLPCSTPNGPGTAYSEWRLSGTIPVFILPWWEHPEKGCGRYVAQDKLGRWKIRSPWYDREEQERSPQELAIEVDMDHIGSGNTFFEAVVIEQHRIMFAKPPLRTMTIGFKKSIADADIPAILSRWRSTESIIATNRGAWRIWAPLPEKRLDQSRTYTIGIDISKGMGASNSVMSVVCNETLEKVAEFADATIPPYELARLASAAALWIGGRTRPLIIWENNGDPGFDFGRQLVRVYSYPNVYFDRQEGTIAEKRGKRYGWRSSREKKATALGQLRRAYAHGGFINHSGEALTEALSYIQYDNGGIGPAELVEETESARQTHGDRVIADMLCVVGAGNCPARKPTSILPPHRSFGGRFRAFKKRKQARSRRQEYFDHRVGVG